MSRGGLPIPCGRNVALLVLCDKSMPATDGVTLKTIGVPQSSVLSLEYL